jgi:hypothetical protein
MRNCFGVGFETLPKSDNQSTCPEAVGLRDKGPPRRARSARRRVARRLMTSQGSVWRRRKATPRAARTSGLGSEVCSALVRLPAPAGKEDLCVVAGFANFWSLIADETAGTNRLLQWGVASIQHPAPFTHPAGPLLPWDINVPRLVHRICSSKLSSHRCAMNIRNRARRRRFMVIPKQGLLDDLSTPTNTVRTLGLLAAPRSTVAAKSAAEKDAPGTEVRLSGLAALQIKVVNRSPADGAVLLEAGKASIAQIQARAPEGAKVYEEHWYPLGRVHSPWLRHLASELKRPHGAREKTRTWTVTVRLDDAKKTRLKGVRVTAMVDEEEAIGAEAVTDRYGRLAPRRGVRGQPACLPDLRRRRRRSLDVCHQRGHQAGCVGWV